MAHIFLSYSRRDGHYVDGLAAAIEQCGIRTWVDRRGIGGGEQWRSEIVAAIGRANALVLFLSPNSARSDNVRKELDLADGAGVRILPICIAPTEIPSAWQYQLAGMQFVEVWRDPDRAVELIVKSLDRHGIKRSGAANSKPQTSPAAPGTDLNLAELGGARIFDNFKLGRWFGRK